MTPPRIPDDGRLPQAARLLDAGAVAPMLERMLGEPVSKVKVRYIRYRPGIRIVVAYKVERGEEEHQAVAVADASENVRAWASEVEHRALADRLADGDRPRERLGYSPELDAFIQWSPLDVALPALAEPPMRLRDLIAAAGVTLDSGEPPRLVKHKPLSRAVLRLPGHVVKVYGNGPLFTRAVHAMQTTETLPFPVPRCEASVPELRLAVQSVVPGKRPASARDVASRAGALLSVLHGSQFDGVPRELPVDRLEAARDEARLLTTIAPQLARRLDAFLQSLEARLPRGDRLVPSHGGFHLSQLLVQGDGRLGAIDFDGACLAPPERDLGSYAVSEVEDPADVPEAAATLDELCRAYGSRPPGVTWYFAALLLRRARRPFSRWKEDWPEQVERRLAAAEEALKL